MIGRVVSIFDKNKRLYYGICWETQLYSFLQKITYFVIRIDNAIFNIGYTDA